MIKKTALLAVALTAVSVIPTYAASCKAVNYDNDNDAIYRTVIKVVPAPWKLHVMTTQEAKAKDIFYGYTCVDAKGIHYAPIELFSGVSCTLVLNTK